MSPHCWLRRAAQRAKSSKCSGVYLTKGSMNSKKSKDSHESGISRTSRDREIKEKMKVAELIADAELLQQKQIIQNEAEKLKIEERLAKAKDTTTTCNNIELKSGNEKEQLSLLHGSLQRIGRK